MAGLPGSGAVRRAHTTVHPSPSRPAPSPARGYLAGRRCPRKDVGDQEHAAHRRIIAFRCPQHRVRNDVVAALTRRRRSRGAAAPGSARSARTGGDGLGTVVVDDGRGVPGEELPERGLLLSPGHPWERFQHRLVHAVVSLTFSARAPCVGPAACPGYGAEENSTAGVPPPSRRVRLVGCVVARHVGPTCAGEPSPALAIIDTRDEPPAPECGPPRAGWCAAAGAAGRTLRFPPWPMKWGPGDRNRKPSCSSCHAVDGSWATFMPGHGAVRVPQETGSRRGGTPAYR